MEALSGQVRFESAKFFKDGEKECIPERGHIPFFNSFLQ